MMINRDTNIVQPVNSDPYAYYIIHKQDYGCFNGTLSFLISLSQKVTGIVPQWIFPFAWLFQFDCCDFSIQNITAWPVINQYTFLDTPRAQISAQAPRSCRNSFRVRGQSTTCSYQLWSNRLICFDLKQLVLIIFPHLLYTPQNSYDAGKEPFLPVLKQYCRI